MHFLLALFLIGGAIDATSIRAERAYAAIPRRTRAVLKPSLSNEHQLEADLLARVAQGDEAAFTELYQRLSPTLFGLAKRIMNDAKEAEDVLQEGFACIWRKAGSFDPARGNPFTWTVMIVRNKGIDKLRVRLRGKRVVERLTVETAAMTAADDASADLPMLSDRAALIRSAMLKIPDEQKQALELAFFGGLTHEQIAEHLQSPLGTVKARVRRGLLRLRDLLKEQIA